jgi:hypothetical protein
MPLNVAVLANLKRNAPRYEGMPADAWDDLDSDITVDSQSSPRCRPAATARPSWKATSRSSKSCPG